MRYIIGIDLGTTNSAVAYVDVNHSSLPIQLFSIPQLISSGRIDTLSTLPSFTYLISQEEWPPGSLKLPWKEETVTFVGQLAKIQGSRIPTRSIQSAKSWLCNVAANRKDKILPIEVADVSLRLSPVEVSAKYLQHIKEAWNATIAKGDSASEFEEQEIILTVPASFDEVARSLTVEAARLAGLNHLTLLEEPQAAFYSWISKHENTWKEFLKAGDSILVCDVGGGTTDFSLIEVHQKQDELVFQRMAVGDHLLLGGDNMDSAIAHYLEQRLIQNGHPSLDSNQWHQLYAEARSAKERLLQPNTSSEESYTVVLQGSGSSVVKSSLTASIHKHELEKILLEGFFSQYDLKSALQLRKSRGFRTMGLPYEDEPSITKHLAHFLQQAYYLDKGVDYLLFNGGAMKPTIFQQAIYESLCLWFPHKELKLLESTSLDLAVSRGAAYYGKVRRGQGISIGGGIPRTYYLQIDVKNSSGQTETKALTLLPRGSQEEAQFEPEQTFFVRPNTPVAFHLLTSHVRLNDTQGSLLSLDPQEIQTLPPIHTILRFGRKQVGQELQESIPVHIGIKLTPIGTLELWLKSEKTEHRWDLEFQLRTAEGQDQPFLNRQERQDETFEKEYVREAQRSIEELFKNDRIKPGAIFEILEEQLGRERREWSSSVLRSLWDPLIKSAAQRKITPLHESRWWNLAGFILRPGFGFPLDDFRIKDLWKIILSELKHSKSLECQIQQWICYRRIAGGLNKGQQMQIASEILPTLFSKKSGKIEVKNKGEVYAYSEKIRALASFERVDLPVKIRLGEAILNRILHQEAEAYDYWALGRIGARHLAYGSVGQVVPRETCTKWVEQLLKVEGERNSQFLFALGQLGKKTDHRELNLADSVIDQIIKQDREGLLKDVIFKQQILNQNEQEQIFGDRLPSGLVLYGN